MKSWQEILKEFKAEIPKYDGAKATLALLCLAVAGELYPSRMAKKFKEGLVQENGWNVEQIKYLRSLKDPNQIRILLRDMEEKNLIVSRKEPKTLVTYYHWYRLDPSICVGGPKEKLCPFHKKQSLREFYLAADFLFCELSDCNLMHYFKLWSQIEVFDFITFLMFLKDEADRLNNEQMKNILSRQIGKRDLEEDLERYERSRIEKEKRKVKWDPK